VALALPAAAWAIPPDRPLRALAREVLDKRAGLPVSGVRAIWHAADGELWLGTDEGLVRYDGAAVTPLSRAEDPGLPSDLVSALAETRDGTLWVGTVAGGLARRRAGRFERFPLEGSAPEVNVRSLLAAPDGALWVATMAGAFRISGERVQPFTMARGLPDDRVKCLAVTRDGVTWIGTRGGLALVAGDEVLPGPARYRGVPIYALAADPGGGVWVASAQGGVTLEGLAEPRRLDRASGLPEAVAVLAVDRDGTLWIGTVDAGLARLRDDKLERLRAGDGLPDPWIGALHEDREGSMWVGTQKGGAVRLRVGTFEALGAPEGLAADAATAVLETRGGDLWVASDGGVDLLAGGAPPARRITGRPALSLLEARGGDVLIGTYGEGLWRWRAGALTLVPGPVPPNTWFRALVEDADGTIWAGTSSGVLRLRAGRLEPVTEGLPVERQSASAVGLSARGELFVGTEASGVFRRGGGHFLPEPAGPSHTALVSSFLADADGTIWMTTIGGGLWRRRAGGYARLTTAQGLLSDSLFAALDDGRGALWLTTGRGVQRVARRELEAVLAGGQESLPRRTYGLADGLRGAGMAGGSGPPAIRTQDGRLWFASDRGIAVADPARAEPEAAAPETRLRAALVDGRPQPLGAPLALPARARRVVVDYTAAVLEGQRQAWFRHRVAGLEDGWSEPQRDRRLQLTFLPPGRHRLEVQARIGDGPWGPAAAVDLVQAPPAWRSPAALAGWALLAVAAAGGWLLARRRRAAAGPGPTSTAR